MANEPEEDEQDRPGVVTTMYAFIRKILIAFGVVLIIWSYFNRSNPAYLQRHTGPHTTETHQEIATETPKEPTPAEQPARISPVAEIPSANRDERMEELQKRIESLEEKIKANAESPAQPDNAAKEKIAQLEEKIEAQEKTVGELKDQLADVSSIKKQVGEIQSQSTRQLSAFTAFGIMKDTILRGEPFAVQLEQLSKLVAGDKNALELIAQIKPYAETGVTIWPALQSQFNDALPLALSPEKANRSWSHNLKNLIRIRKEGEQQKGTDDQSVLARAEAKIARRDVAGTVREIETLSKPALAAFVPWLKNAKAFLDTGKAVDALQLSLINADTSTPVATPAPAPVAESPAEPAVTESPVSGAETPAPAPEVKEPVQ